MSRLKSFKAVETAVGDRAPLYRITADENAQLPYVVATFAGSEFGGDEPLGGGMARDFNWFIDAHHTNADLADALADDVEASLARNGFRTTRDGEAEVTEYVASATINASITL